MYRKFYRERGCPQAIQVPPGWAMGAGGKLFPRHYCPAFYMTDKELRGLSRSELLEMLIIETKENARLRSEPEQARAELADRRILLGNCGSMAEAALRLNGVFEAVDKAALQYLENIQCLAEEKTENHESFIPRT